MSQKIQISKAGISAGTATNPDDLTFSSDYNTLKYNISGSLVMSVTGGSPFVQRGTVAHGLGYYPAHIVYTDAGLNFTPRRNFPLGYSFADAGVYFNVFSYMGTNNLVIEVQSSGVFGTVTVNNYYKIFKNNLNL